MGVPGSPAALFRRSLYLIMQLSRETIEGLNEADLRREILLPLFVAMGFRDVTECHGPEEYGKDFVMWKPDVIRSRQNYAVVVKAEKIDRSNRDEVQSQIQQCFGAPFPDPISGEERSVDKAIVVSSKKITQHAKNAIRAVLRTVKLDERVDFLDGDVLLQRLHELLSGPVQKLDPEVLAKHFGALVDADWREADRHFWEEMREREGQLELAGMFGSSSHSFERNRLCEQDVKRRTEMLLQRAGEVLLASKGAVDRALGETIKRTALQRLEAHIDSLEDKLDDSGKAGRHPPFGRPNLPKQEMLAALDARFFVLLARGA